MKKNIKVESLCTFRCNCNCIMCSVATKNNQDKTEESFKEVKRDIDIAAKLGANTFAFSGGEPTLREDLLQLVRYARKKIPNIEIQSNGRMYYYKNYCQKLIEAGVKNFVISLHSPYEDISDRIMGARGAYLQTITGIKNLKNLKQKVKINTVILKLNYRDLPKLARFLLNLKIDEVRFVYPTLEGNVLKDPYNILARISTISPYLQKAIKIVSKKIPVSVYNVTPCFLPKYEKFITDIGGAETYLRGPNFECLLNKNRKKMKIKSSICDDCIYNNHCYGILKNYVKFFGFDELKLKQSSK